MNRYTPTDGGIWVCGGARIINHRAEPCPGHPSVLMYATIVNHIVKGALFMIHGYTLSTNGTVEEKNLVNAHFLTLQYILQETSREFRIWGENHVINVTSN